MPIMKKIYLVQTKYGLDAFNSNKSAKKFARIMNCEYKIIPLVVYGMQDL